jgi:ribosomal protein L34E
VGVDIIAVPDEPPPQQTKRTRRAEPITKRTAKNGSITYEFRADVGNKPDGTRDRRRFTYRTLSQARREYRRITSEVATGTYTRKSAITVAEACDEWLAGRRGIRRVTLQGYTHDLKPVRRNLGGKKLQQLTKADGDELVEWMLTEDAPRQSDTVPAAWRPA